MKKSSRQINMDLIWFKYDERETVSVLGRK